MIQNAILEEQEQDLLQGAKESDAEVALYVLLDKQPSGMIREGTENLPEPDQLMAPGFRSILTHSAYRVKLNKNKGGGWKRVAIRFRYGCEDIDPKIQNASGYEEPVPENDRILFKNGKLTVVREGATVGLFDFMRKNSYNSTNPDRIPSAVEIYKEVFPDKETEEDIHGMFTETAAFNFLEQLVTDKTPGKMKYDEPRLRALSQFHRVVAETPGGLIKGLYANARLDPKKFLAESQQFEQSSMIEIAHAEKLGVIKFENNRVLLVGKNIILHTYSDKFSDEQKYRSLAGLFSSPEGMNKYKEFAIELSAAKERNASSDK